MLDYRLLKESWLIITIAGPTVAIGSIKKIANITVNQGVKEADRTAGDLLSPVWNSQDLKRGREAMQKTGPGTAAFEGN